MADIDEKRIFAKRSGATDLVVAARPGLAVVSVSDGRVGEFGLARRCSPTDVAARPVPGSEHAWQLAVATTEDVLLAAAADVSALEPSGFGPAAVVTFDDVGPVAGAPDGTIARADDGGWETVGTLPDVPTAIDGDLIGTRDGVFRLLDGELRVAGLDRVSDVGRVAGMPLAATAAGLYELGNGWLDVLTGDFRVVAGAPDGRAHAATASACFERRQSGWQVVELPSDGAVSAVTYGTSTYVVTAGGDIAIEGPDGWHGYPLGLDDVVAAAVL